MGDSCVVLKYTFLYLPDIVYMTAEKLETFQQVF